MAREHFLAAGQGRTLDILYVLTNAGADWFAEFKANMLADGWGTVVSGTDFVLDDEQKEVDMAMDMEIARRAAVFIGNGVRATPNLEPVAADQRWCSGPRSQATSCTGVSWTDESLSRTASGDGHADDKCQVECPERYGPTAIFSIYAMPRRP
jgi:hypothetical protein